MIRFQHLRTGGALALVHELGVSTATRAFAATTAVTLTVTLTVTLALILAATLVPTESFAQNVPKTDDEKAFYSIGSSLAQQLEIVKPISEHELDLLIQGIRDSVAGNTLAVDPNEGSTRVKNLLEARQAKALEIEKAASAAFLAAEANRDGAQTTETGLIITEIKAGSGASPSATDKVRVHYHGTLRDGSVFDSSVDRGEPAEFPLNRVIACWTEGVAMMKTGGKSRLVCPAKIAYGDRRGNGRIPPGAALTFEVELLEIVE